MMCKITNLISTSVVIEDISIRLQPAGGKDSSAIIDASVAKRSKDLKNRCAKWVKIEWYDAPRPARLPSPVSPASSLAATLLPMVEPVPVPAVPAPVSSAPVFPSIDILEKTVQNVGKKQDDIERKQDEILTLLRSSPSVRIGPTMSGPVVDPSDPMMIPDHILPDSAEISVKVREDRIERHDFDITRKALKKLKGSNT